MDNVQNCDSYVEINFSNTTSTCGHDPPNHFSDHSQQQKRIVKVINNDCRTVIELLGALSSKVVPSRRNAVRSLNLNS
jgi:hypothetical protein